MNNGLFLTYYLFLGFNGEAVCFVYGFCSLCCEQIIMSIYVLHLISDEGISLSRSANAYTEAS